MVPLIFCTLLALTCSIELSYSSPPAGGIKTVTCPRTNVFKGVTCGRFEVPLDYHQPYGERLSLWFAVINGTIEEPKVQALTVISGGPGSSTSSSILPIVRQAPLEIIKQPTILLDARGTGFSQVLVCNNSTSSSSPFERDPQKVKQCGIELGQRRIHFSSANNARDLEMLRRQLLVGRWNMLGISAGTQVVLYSAYLFPGSSRTFVMDGAFTTNVPVRPGVDLYRRLKKSIYVICKRTSKCSGDTFFKNLDVVLRHLRQSPNEIVKPYTLGGLVGSLSDIANLSRALNVAAKGNNFTPLEKLVLRQNMQAIITFKPEEFSDALSLATTCLEFGVPWSPYDDESIQLAIVEQRVRAANVKDFVPFLPDEFMRLNSDQRRCIGWPRLPFGVDFRKIVPPLPRMIDTKGTPVLVVAGELDLATTLESGREVVQKFNNVEFAQIGNTGHVTLVRSQCAVDLAFEFIRTAKFSDTSNCSDPASQPSSP